MSDRRTLRARGPALRAAVLYPVLWLVAATGCAGLGGTIGDRGPGPAEPMDAPRLERLFAAQAVAITGPPGAIEAVIDDVKLYCISDPERDHMRLVAPIAHVSQLDPRVFEAMLHANFHSTRDARYAVSEGVVFATFLHPISSLTADHLRSATSQVVSLVHSFGTTFSAGDPRRSDVPDASAESERRD